MKYLMLSLLWPAAICNAQGGWTKITTGPVTTFTSNGIYKGAAWVDINNDGLVDLFAMPNYLFLNSGAGSFTQLTGLNINPAPLQNPGGCSWGDLDNDGDIDFITAQNPSEIYLNNGNNTFQNVSASVPALSGFASWGCALADLNNDSRLDLLYAQAYGFHGTATPYPCKLFTQSAAGFSFAPVTGYAFTDSLRPYTVPYFNDYDMDGDMDLFIATGPGGSPGPDYCYRNMKKETGKDTLHKMTAEPWAAQLQDGQCYNTVDTDNDGDLDLCLTNYKGAPSRFFVNGGAGTYSAISTPFTTTSQKLSNCWGDYDNDGDLDVLIAVDNAPVTYYRNTGNNVFVAVPGSVNVTSGGSAIVNCDYDNDGDLDVFVHGSGGARSLWRNDTVAAGRNWINISLRGVVSNRSAIGAFVKVKAKINGNDVWQLRHVNAQNSFQGQNDLRIHVGLGNAAMIDTIVISWPSGIRERYTGVGVNQFITCVEGNGSQVGVGEKNADASIAVYPNPSQGVINVKVPAACHSFKVKLCDAAGGVLYTGETRSDKAEIPVSHYKPGSYVVSVEACGRAYVRKIIIN